MISVHFRARNDKKTAKHADNTPRSQNIPIDFGVIKMKGLNSALDIILPVKIYFPFRFKEKSVDDLLCFF